MRKRIFSVILALCMVLGLLPMTAWAAPVQSVKIGTATLNSDTPYYHNGPDGAQGYADDNPTDANATFNPGPNPGTGTLTLNNLDVANGKIWWEYKDSGAHDLTIILKNGTINTITNNTANSPAIHGESGYISGGPSLTIKGKGTLYATGGASASGIWVWNNVTIEDKAEVHATGRGSMGIGNQSSVGTITIKGNAKVYATGATYGIGWSNGIGDDSPAKQPVISGNAVVVAKGGTAAFRKAPDYTSSGKIKVSDNIDGSSELIYEQSAYDADKSVINNKKYVKFNSDETVWHTHCVCGASHANVGDHTSADNKTFEAWNETNALPTTAGYYYLTDNVSISSTWEPANGTFLCLNGKKITMTDSYATIKLTSGVTFTLTDCKTGDYQGAITHADGKTGYGVHNEGTFNMYSGKITKNSLPTDDTSGGAGVKNGLNEGASAQFTMYGGEISNNNSSNWNGGGVDSNGTFTMYGGSIKNNTAASNKNGGGVYINDGTFNVSGNVNISGNTTGGNANNVFLPSGKTITIAGALSNTTPIGVTTADIPAENSPVAITGENSANYSSKFASEAGFRVVDKVDGENHVVQLESTSTPTPDPTPTVSITPSTTSMRGKGTVTLTVTTEHLPAGADATVSSDVDGITITPIGGGTYSVYLPNRTQTYTFTAKAIAADSTELARDTCTVSVRKKSSSSSVEEEKPTEKPEEKPEEKPVDKPEVKPEEVSKNNEIILTIGQRAAVVFGDPVVNDVAPVIRSDRAMLPIRFVAEALGGTVTWNQAEQSVTCVKGDNTITIYIGHPFALVNGNPVELDSPAFIENDRTYLPIRFVAENLDATVTWDADTQEVTVVPDK